MPAKELSPKEFEELSKHILTTDHKKGIGAMQTNLSEKQITRQDIRYMFEYIDQQGREYIHTIEIRSDDKSSKPFFIHRDSLDRT